ncbi:MAG: MarR family winged helix-turn-helix transcriptional regulator [Candidatus Onthomonas sp.]
MESLWSNVDLLRRGYIRRLESVCSQFGLTRMELDVLLFLASNPTRDTASEMIRTRGFSKSHVSAAVKRLIQQGCLKGVTRSGNHKAIHLQLLPPAEAAVRAGQAAQEEFFRFLFQTISPEERETLVRVLSQMVAQLAAENPKENP